MANGPAWPGGGQAITGHRASWAVPLRALVGRFTCRADLRSTAKIVRPCWPATHRERREEEEQPSSTCHGHERQHRRHCRARPRRRSCCRCEEAWRRSRRALKLRRWAPLEAERKRRRCRAARGGTLVSGGGGASWFGIWRCRARACAGGREADRHPCLHC